ncbi:hypothetical protein [Actinomadura sediminis]|uniref:DUF2637 domain-containing protein n=1 Tax=Actinomadura sediminis TaxID=1038904 RepID=A0ABW3F0U3_9ACTN
MRARIAPGRALTAAAGLALIAVGLHGVATNVETTGWALWFAVPVLAHDAVLVPAVLAAGWLTGRLPAPARTPVRAALAAAGCLVLVALPLVLGYGRRADVPSRLPLPYGRNLAVVLTAIAVAAALAAAVRVHRARRAEPRGRPAETGPGEGTAEAGDGGGGRR